MPDHTRTDRCVVLLRDAERHVVVVELDEKAPLGLRVHVGQRDAAIRRQMARSVGTVCKQGSACVFDGQSGDHAEALVLALRKQLRNIAGKPLSQRQVEDILKITSRERLRWCKDGRLPRSGTARIRKGKTQITLWTYPCHAIERLALSSEMIRGWRDADQARSSIGIAGVLV
ncbi:hypothetical protein ACQKO5_10845 [Novosphingobium subterraneum]|uniref:hypothetical protein n=1 Tax=Novosphingobium subterraneum TaxID=48936 RepID=UPI003D03E083